MIGLGAIVIPGFGHVRVLSENTSQDHPGGGSPVDDAVNPSHSVFSLVCTWHVTAYTGIEHAIQWQIPSNGLVAVPGVRANAAGRTCRQRSHHPLNVKTISGNPRDLISLRPSPEDRLRRPELPFALRPI